MNNNEIRSILVHKGIKVYDLLNQLDINEYEDKDQLLIVYKGLPVFLEDCIYESGEIVIMPLLSGG